MTKQARQQLINSIITTVNKRQAKDKKHLLQAFIQQYLGLLSYDDLRERTISDFVGIILSHWNFMQGRESGESRVRVFNPTDEEHGWQSPHTIIQISHDDMLFLVDSTRMEINRYELGIHFLIHVGGMKVHRDQNNEITEILPWGSPQVEDCVTEAPIYIEIDKNTDATFLQKLKDDIERVLIDVKIVVDDWHAMRRRVTDSIKSLEENPPELDVAEIKESKDFLSWIENNNFTFLGCRDYNLVGEGENKALKILSHSGLGVLRDTTKSLKYRNFSDMTPEALSLMLSPQALTIAKTNTFSTVHRPVYSDYIGIKRFDKNGKLIGERRLIGLFTAAAYNSSVQTIPYLRLKVARIINNSGLLENSHARKALLNILETFPRDDLFQGTIEELQEIAMGIFNIQERSRVRLFLRKDIYNRYISCLVYIPRQRFTNKLRKAIQTILESNFTGKKTEYNAYFSESVLARIRYVIRTDPQIQIEYNSKKIEQQIIAASNSWYDQLYKVLLNYYDEEQGLELFRRYLNAFPAGYRERNNANTAVSDIKYLEEISALVPLKVSLNAGRGKQLKFKIYHYKKTAPISDVMPILENMGLRALREFPSKIKLDIHKKKVVWINDFHMAYDENMPFNIRAIKTNLQQTFIKVWQGELENDGFNKLILLAELDWREISVLRAMAKYLRQINVNYSQMYIENTLNHYPNIARILIKLFNMRFNPQLTVATVDTADIEMQLEKALDDVTTLDEDRILRLYLVLIKAMTRTNYFQQRQQQRKTYLSFKFSSELIPQLPKPVPKFEMFVYSSRFEGIHLRCGKVARGGIRWSDRREDFRTEILGLMKAQQVKNSLIVPTGAKGGFVIKNIAPDMSREHLYREARNCYKDFIRGLLDLTDNYIDDNIYSPENIVRYDEEDTYLVVAADKGTAAFSDIANKVAAEYDFWLGDAFASGGKTGYDHKKMGITARGAWVSVTQHFKHRNIDISKEDFTVIGIGDMSGDVFGNGMLLSKHICLVASFNHQHIFLDPNPDATSSYVERERLFHLPRSSWKDYNPDLISRGGGVFSRTQKSIKLSTQVKELLAVGQDYMAPNDLIHAILCAKVDLLWNGGIGTYVKATEETNAEVGDRANDALRVDAHELHCAVVGEGGNLGFTQLARVEYALNGGAIYTDFIDNSAGVDCSDKEVNSKILLSKAMQQNILQMPQRNRLLRGMTDEVAKLVLYNNYQQTRIIELVKLQATEQVDVYARFVNLLEEKNIIDRNLEALPSVDALVARKAQGRGLTAPEIAVLICYSKILLQSNLLESDLPEDPWFTQYLYAALPRRLTKQFATQLTEHRLRREIIATQLSNDLVNYVGPLFIYRMYHETGATYVDIMRAYVAAKECFNMESLWQQIQTLDFKVPAQIQNRMMLYISKLVRRSSRWLINRYYRNLNIVELITTYKTDVQKLSTLLPEIFTGEHKERFIDLCEKMQSAGVPLALAEQVATSEAMFLALEIIDTAHREKVDLEVVAKIYFQLGEQLDLNWLRQQIYQQRHETHWEDLALVGVFDDINKIQANLVVDIIRFANEEDTVNEQVQGWLTAHQRLIKRWMKMIANMRSSNIVSPVMLFVGLRELANLARTCSAKKQCP